MRTQFTADSGLKHYLKATIHKVNSLYLVENNRAALYTWYFRGKNSNVHYYIQKPMAS